MVASALARFVSLGFSVFGVPKYAGNFDQLLLTISIAINLTHLQPGLLLLHWLELCPLLHQVLNLHLLVLHRMHQMEVLQLVTLQWTLSRKLFLQLHLEPRLTSESLKFRRFIKWCSEVCDRQSYSYHRECTKTNYQAPLHVFDEKVVTGMNSITILASIYMKLFTFEIHLAPDLMAFYQYGRDREQNPRASLIEYARMHCSDKLPMCFVQSAEFFYLAPTLCGMCAASMPCK